MVPQTSAADYQRQKVTENLAICLAATRVYSRCLGVTARNLAPAQERQKLVKPAADCKTCLVGKGILSAIPAHDGVVNPQYGGGRQVRTNALIVSIVRP